MPTFDAPGVYVQEVAGGARPIEAVGTSTAGFVGVAPNKKALVQEITAVNNWTEFVRKYVSDGDKSTPLAQGVHGFFLNGGQRCYVVNIGTATTIGSSGQSRGGVDLLAEIDEIAIVAAPGYTDVASYDALLTHCESLEDRVAVLDSPTDVTAVERLIKVASVDAPSDAETDGNDGVRARQSEYGAYYFPWIQTRDPLAAEQQILAPPSGHMAGIWARTDGTRGVHKAPANEGVRGALGLAYNLTRAEQGELNRNGVNAIRFFGTDGVLVWGARTLAESSSEWRYLNVRRLFNMIKESIEENTRWIVFEPNDQTLWKSIRRDISAFLTLLWRDGALMGATPEEAFFVKCDAETNPPDVINAGRVVTLIGIAPVKPAEFIIFRISQFDSGTATEL